jgi:hypothetical protein
MVVLVAVAVLECAPTTKRLVAVAEDILVVVELVVAWEQAAVAEAITQERLLVKD